MPAFDDIANDALGAGLQFPIGINDRGGLAVSRYEQKVRESVLAILSTARGERVMRPEFGCDIHKFVFTTTDAISLTRIRSAVREALVRWEPRIEVNAVDVAADPDREAQLRIGVTYTIRITNSVGNLVYPFYLNSGN